MSDNIITINGQKYDSVTGLPIHGQATGTSYEQAKPQNPTHDIIRHATNHVAASKVHSNVQRSTTLRRQSVHRPLPAKHQINNHVRVRSMDIARPVKSTSIHKFSPQPAAPAVRHATPDIAPVKHPAVERAHQKSEAKSQTLTDTLSASKIKDTAIQNAIAKTSKQKPLKTKWFARQRVFAMASSALAVVILAGYFTYLNIPSLSMRVASSQAGVNASLPGYHPSGYALNGKITYSTGSVAVNYKANGGDQHYTVRQSKSNWDSTALLDDYINPRAGSNYVPYTENGLTIYTYDNNAAWVNGGVLYTIEGDAPLSSTQIRQIALSLL